jgi:hypothetical protein
MWWDHQNLDKSRRDKSGKRWNFRVWHDVIDGRHRARVFFWDDPKVFCGVRVFAKEDDTHITSLRDFIEKLLAKTALRQKYRRDLTFPLERHYSEYGAFPEEERQA